MEGSAVLVTGSASGIGRASTMAFLAAGARVAALDVDAAGWRSCPTRARLAELPDEMVHLRADVRRPDEIEHAIASAVSEFGRRMTGSTLVLDGGYLAR